MKMNEMKQELIKDHMRSSRTYCYYCLEPQDDKYSCCQENHFGEFKDLDDYAQDEIINGEIEEYEKWRKVNA